MPQEISNAVAHPSSKPKSNIVRGYNLNAEDVADIQLLADHDRRSLSFLVRDAISMYLRSRQEELQQFKTLEEKVQP